MTLCMPTFRIASASDGLGKLAPIHTFWSKYSLGFFGRISSAGKPSSPTRPEDIW